MPRRLAQLVVRAAPGYIAGVDALGDPGESRAGTVRRLIREGLVRQLGEVAAREILKTKQVPVAPWRLATTDASDAEP